MAYKKSGKGGKEAFYEYDQAFSVDIPRTKEIKPSGLGKKTYTVYIVEIRHGLEEFSSELRYSEFRKLHAVVHQRYPDVRMPHLPSKKYVGNNTGDEFVQKRKLKLERYLRVLLANRDVRYGPEIVKLLHLPKQLQPGDADESTANNSSSGALAAAKLGTAPVPTQKAVSAGNLLATSPVQKGTVSTPSRSTLLVPGASDNKLLGTPRTESIYSKEYLSDASSAEESQEEENHRKAKALFRFGFEPGDAAQGYLRMEKDDVVLVIEEHESGWWTGELDGQVGYFPSDFIQYLPSSTTATGAAAAVNDANSSHEPEEQTLPNPSNESQSSTSDLLDNKTQESISTTPLPPHDQTMEAAVAVEVGNSTPKEELPKRRAPPPPQRNGAVLDKTQSSATSQANLAVPPSIPSRPQRDASAEDISTSIQNAQVENNQSPLVPARKPLPTPGGGRGGRGHGGVRGRGRGRGRGGMRGRGMRGRGMVGRGGRGGSGIRRGSGIRGGGPRGRGNAVAGNGPPVAPRRKVPTPGGSVEAGSASPNVPARRPIRKHVGSTELPAPPAGGIAGGAAVAGTAGSTGSSSDAARTNIAKEILSTEESYVSALRTIIDVYLSSLRAAGIAGDILSRIFANVELILGVNTVLLEDLKKRLASWNASTTLLGDCLLQLTPYFKMYTEYGNGYEQALKVHSKLMSSNPEYAAIIMECDGKKTTTLDLEALLIQPIQRIPRYNLLLKDFLKHTDESHPDHQNLVKVLSMMKGVADHINESIRQYESQMQFVNISSKSAGLEALIAPHRHLVKDGQLYVVPSSRLRMRKKRRFILFNDIIVIASESSTSDTMRPEYKWNLKLTWIDESKMKKNKFLLIGPEVSYMLQSDSSSETTQWLSKIKELSNGLLAEDNMDIYSESRHGRHDYIDDIEYYEGEWKNAKREGSGKFYYADGTVYSGAWTEDRPTGQATITYATHSVYRGNVVEGTPQEKGTLTFADGSVYEGAFLNGLRHGIGSMKFADGSQFEGEWEKGLFLKGQLRRGDYVYDGKFNQGRREGNGVCVYGTGAKYDGYWRDGKRDGMGLYRAADGSEYRGTFSLNLRDGKGRCAFADGTVYEGQWKNDLPHGKGELLFSNGATYEGDFQYGRRNGRGKLLDAAGLTYEGEWKDDRPHGHGVYITPDQLVQYEAKFSSGRVEGRCTIRRLQSGFQVGGSYKEGHYRSDILQEMILEPISLPEVEFGLW